MSVVWSQIVSKSLWKTTLPPTDFHRFQLFFSGIFLHISKWHAHMDISWFFHLDIFCWFPTMELENLVLLVLFPATPTNTFPYPLSSHLYIINLDCSQYLIFVLVVFTMKPCRVLWLHLISYMIFPPKVINCIGLKFSCVTGCW